MKSISEGEKINNSECFLNYIAKSIGYKSVELKKKYGKLYFISRKFNITVDELKELNNLESSQIFFRQILRIL